MAALTIDVGNMVLSRSKLQNASDAAALAATLELWVQGLAGADEAVAREHAIAEATRFVQINYPEAGAKVAVGLWEDSTFVPADDTTQADAARVIAFRSESAPGGPLATFFAMILGPSAVNQDALSTAKLSHSAMVPFGVWEDYLVPAGQNLIMYDNEGVVPGCFGLLDFNGGDHSAEEAKYWTRYGYYGPFDIDPSGDEVIAEGTTGLKTSIKAGVSYHIAEGDTVIACIYRDVWGAGSNAYFRIVGLVAITITGHEFEDDDEEEYDHLTGSVVATHFFSDGLDDDFRYDFMQLRLVE